MNHAEKKIHDQHVAEFKAGVHRHRKGGLYVGLFLARALESDSVVFAGENRVLVAHHHDTREPLEVYVSPERGIFIRSSPGATPIGDTYEDGGDEWVVYVSQTTGAVCARPLARPGEDSWTDPTDYPLPDGAVAVWPRFSRIVEQPK